MPAGIHLGPANGIRTIDTNDEATESDLHYDTVFPRMSFTTASREEFFPFTAYAVLAVGAAGRTPLRADTRYATKWDPIELRRRRRSGSGQRRTSLHRPGWLTNR